MTLCDSHIHVVGDPARHPMIPQRTYTPPPAAIGTLQQIAAPHGITRFVVVQPSFYGTDNTLVVEALRALGGDGRGVAVVDPAAVTQAELDAMAEAGVRGLRINLYSTHGVAATQSPAERYRATAALAARMGWHVQVIAFLPVLAEVADLLGSSPVPVVIDHYGLPTRDAGPGSAEAQRLLGLLRHGHAWVKLSAPYRSVGDELAVAPDRAWLSALLDAAGDRCVWGSDWPHTPGHAAHPGGAGPAPYRALDYAAVVAGFRDALPTPEAADRIMGANAARLYGFDD